jgi:hypothetical protein
LTLFILSYKPLNPLSPSPDEKERLESSFLTESKKNFIFLLVVLRKDTRFSVTRTKARREINVSRIDSSLKTEYPSSNESRTIRNTLINIL